MHVIRPDDGGVKMQLRAMPEDRAVECYLTRIRWKRPSLMRVEGDEQRFAGTLCGSFRL
jgi:hypothetical protein